MYSKAEIKILTNAADKLEPEAKAVGEITNAPERAIFLSIAISLKRIADKLELSQKQPVIMSAEEYSKYCAEKNGH